MRPLNGSPPKLDDIPVSVYTNAKRKDTNLHTPEG